MSVHPLFNRICHGKENLKPVQSSYRIVYTKPDSDSAAIVVPDPNWMAMALAGYYLPPVEVYGQLEHDDNGRIINGHILHERTIGPMTEEEAMEYLVVKDVPDEVWQDVTSNVRRFVICSVDQIPADRKWRNCWRLKNDTSFN